MQLHNTSQYAIRILSYLELHKDQPRLSAKEISKHLAIPYKFLTKIMGELSKAGLIQSIRGREGGYTLNKPASTITISDILDIFNDALHQEQCVLGIGFCDTANSCVLHDQWVEPKALIEKMFYENSIADIAYKGDKQ